MRARLAVTIVLLCSLFGLFHAKPSLKEEGESTEEAHDDPAILSLEEYHQQQTLNESAYQNADYQTKHDSVNNLVIRKRSTDEDSECDQIGLLGMENRSISDLQISASSFYIGQGELRPWKGRLNNDDYWAASTSIPSNPWIQVDFLSTVTMTGIITQGGAHSRDEWVSVLQIQYGDTDNSLSYILDGNAVKSFHANSDRDTPVTISFPEPISARFLRIRPTAWNAWCSLRFEVIGYTGHLCQDQAHAGEDLESISCDSRDGRDGRDGQNGVNGINGSDGRDGRRGYPGLAGSVGPIGPQGPAGSPGPPGQDISSPGLSVYIRWGRTRCPSTAEFIYKGFAAGSSYLASGGGANYVCLPETPEFGSFTPGERAYAGKLYSVEFEGGSKFEYDSPCVACLAMRSAMIMIPAKMTCPTGWTREYEGYLMSQHDGYNNSEFVCVDGDPEGVPGSEADQDGSLFYFVEGRCNRGNLACNTYGNGAELRCVVCTK